MSEFHDISFLREIYSGIHSSGSEYFLNHITKATRAKPNVSYFCEARQCANNRNPLKVNINAFSHTFECEQFPQIF